MRVTDILLSFPEMIVAMFLVAILGANYVTLTTALVIGGWHPVRPARPQPGPRDRAP